MKPVDRHYCPICGNVLAESSSVCLHCATPIERPGADLSKAGVPLCNRTRRSGLRGGAPLRPNPPELAATSRCEKDEVATRSHPALA